MKFIHVRNTWGTSATIAVDGNKMSIARCSAGDQFSKKRGRELSTIRHNNISKTTNSALEFILNPSHRTLEISEENVKDRILEVKFYLQCFDVMSSGHWKFKDRQDWINNLPNWPSNTAASVRGSNGFVAGLGNHTIESALKELFEESQKFQKKVQ